MNSIDDLTFDSQIGLANGSKYELGNNLHYIMTEDFEIAEDKKVQQSIIEKLKGFNVTYDVLLNNTIRKRSDTADPHRVTNGIEIKAPIEIVEDTRTNKPESTTLPKRETSNADTKTKPKTTKEPEPKKEDKPKSKTTPTPDPAAKPKVAPLFYISTQDAIDRYYNWANNSGVGAINYAIQVCIETSKNPKNTPDEKISIGTIPVERNEFLAIISELVRSGNLDKMLRPANELKTKIDELARLRAEIAQRAR